MKVKLLKRIRAIGRNQVTLYSITTSRGCVTGMSYGYNGDDYSGLFDFDNTFEEVQEKALNIYIDKNIDYYRKKYKKYTRKYKHRIH